MAKQTSIAETPVFVEPAQAFAADPELFLNIAFVGDEADIPDYAQWLIKHSCYLVDSLEEADIVIFGGGDDIDPQLYGESMHSSVFIDPARDEEDILYYEEARAIGIPILGICRGAQLGHALEGGKLYQDIDKHNDGYHSAYAPMDKQYISEISSVHHQACQPRNDDRMAILLNSWDSSYRQKTANGRVSSRLKVDGKTEPDIEAFFYRDACFFGVQGHPEYGGFPDYTAWVTKKLDQLFVTSPDTEFREGRLRLKRDLIKPLAI